MKKIVALLFALAVMAVSLEGCGPFWVNPYITVQESQLNWVNIHYYNTRTKPIRRVSVYLSGSGHVEVRKGTSDQVGNDFAKKYEDENWNKVESKRYMVDPKHLNNVFQELVNHGLLDREKLGKASKKTSFDRFISVSANLCNHTYSEPYNVFEVDPDLAEVLLDTVRQFDTPGRVR